MACRAGARMSLHPGAVWPDDHLLEKIDHMGIVLLIVGTPLTQLMVRGATRGSVSAAGTARAGWVWCVWVFSWDGGGGGRHCVWVCFVGGEGQGAVQRTSTRVRASPTSVTSLLS
jgi:hypothetical protein